MGGITISGSSNARATQKLLSEILSFLFEQKYGEMKYFTEPQKKSLEKVSRDLRRVIKKADA
jgi:hypothetical protein